ncbi:MAG: ribulose-phosphate 3-epimerase [Chloroflexi bacterium]|nr:ribulose-phosphate 3-epimerase [Chloroflexota bacterium]
MTTMTHRTVQISPSMMCADLWRLAEQVGELEVAGVELLHFDLMDAHYVPNMPLGLGMLQSLRPHTTIPFDVHLMVEHNDFFVELLAPIGVQQISVHAESAIHLDRTLSLIRSYGIQAGVALNPATPLDALNYVWEQLDFVLIMTVNPGYAGQKLVPSALRKIADCRNYLQANGLSIPIQVDGNVSFEHIPSMVAAGANCLVGGTSSVFHRDGSIVENVARTRQVIARGLENRS